MTMTDEPSDTMGARRAPGPWRRLWSGLAAPIPDGGESASVKRGAATALLVRIASAGILYLSQIVLARWMGGFEYGIYVFVWTWVLVLGGLCNLGLSTLVIRLVPEQRERRDFVALRGVLIYGRVIPLGAATLVAGLALLLLTSGAAILSQPYVLPALIALACVPIITLSDVQDGIGRGCGWMGAALLPPYVLRPLLVLVAMIGAHAMGWPMTAATAAVAAVAGTWTAGVVQTILIQRRLRLEVPAGKAGRPQWALLATSMPLLAITFCEILVQNVDVLVISQVMSPADVGLYFAAAKTMSLVMFVHYAVGSAMAARFASLNARGDQQGLRRAVAEAVNWTFWPSLAAAIVILALGRPLLWLFGPQFEAAYPVMCVLVLGFLGRAAMGPSEFLLNMLGQQRASAAAALSIAALDVMLNVLLVPMFGLVGAASATAIALLAGAVVNTIIARRRLGLDIAIWSNLCVR